MIELLLMPATTVVDAKNRPGVVGAQPDFLSEMLKTPLQNAPADKLLATSVEIEPALAPSAPDMPITTEAAPTWAWDPNLQGGPWVDGGHEADAPSMGLHVHVASPEEEINLPMASEIEVIEVAAADTDRIAVAAPWRLLASWLLARSERVGGATIPSEGLHARDVAKLGAVNGVVPLQAVAVQAGRDADPIGVSGGGLPHASRSEPTSQPTRPHETHAAATESVIASHAWQARLMKLLEHATQPDAKAWVRDFRLSESDIQTLTFELREFFSAKGKQLTSVWINGRNTWLKARDE